MTENTYWILDWIFDNCKGCRHVKRGFCYARLQTGEKREKTTTVARRYLTKNGGKRCNLRNWKLEEGN